jgi:hypothetical protein
MVSRVWATYANYASDQVSNVLVGLTASNPSFLEREEHHGRYGVPHSRLKLGDQRSHGGIRRSVIPHELTCINYRSERLHDV